MAVTIYDVAKESGALVVPVATYRNGSKSYGIMGEAFNICDYDKTNGLIILRDKMATMQYEMMEEYGRCERKNLPYGSDADNYWDNYINDLMSEVKFYEYELEKNTKYREKNITPPNEAFAFMDKLIPSKENAFLFRNNLYIRRDDL